ncbi:MAG: lysine--tRNA ligase [Candidatus Aenigmatarchaeota archaeon]|nr:MAG: lysine--tRNA ligase [Candidatus Aenigmarchaeota archaeon]
MRKSDFLFWADRIANDISERKSFHFIGKPIQKPKKYTIKTSASLSGVLHIGRLSDTIRGESVYKALLDQGKKPEFIWVAEDMDPLRKIPKGVPESYSKFIGMPVTDIPDPEGCHDSYAEHYMSEYIHVMKEFVSSDMKIFSMRKEYKKGNFNPYIKILLENTEKLKEIQNKYRSKPLPDTWSPWQPICENCGKIITPRVTGVRDGLVCYKCMDYRFEKTIAKGCGHEGVNNPLEGNGKLVWKSEWASQWARWEVVSEGAGKEYQVPGSAFWINGEIAEKILGFPMPVPIFYEHLMINGEKMSASKGNVVYPAEWLKVAPPELLRFMYNKKLMKMRSFSWDYLPNLYDDYNNHEKIYYGVAHIKNKKEELHMKRLYEISQLKLSSSMPLQIPFDFAAMLSQIFQEHEKAIEVLRRTGHIKRKLSKKDIERIKSMLGYARNWALTYAQEKYRISLPEKPQEETLKELSEPQRSALKQLGKRLREKSMDEKEIYSLLWDIIKSSGLSAPEFFEAAYLVLLNKRSGPRLTTLILVIGQEKTARILEQI